MENSEVIEETNVNCKNLSLEPVIDQSVSLEKQALAPSLEAHRISNSLETLNLSPSPSLLNGVAHPSEREEIEYISYKSELQMPDIMRLIQKDLSEPYSIYTYRYFIHNWPKLCFLVNF